MHKHRTPVPQEKHHIQPQSRNGQTIPTNLALICANAHGNVHYLLDLVEDVAVEYMKRNLTVSPQDVYNTVPRDVRNTYSPTERRIALQGWLGYAAKFLAGGYAEEYRTVSTSGHPKD